ncbi:uncharacterized protein, partial [Montipora capricornis]|uniref:uncharacterized protein n=1 Tax=Montipora capricornis TaxID=246305 RepID=UPI0035F186D1
MNSANERTDINLQCQVPSPSATSTITTTSTATAAFNATSLFNFPGISTHRFPLPGLNQAAHQNITGVPTQPPSVQASYAPYMNYAYPPFNSIPTISSHAFPFDSCHGHYQPTSSRLQMLAPKPLSDAHVKSTGASQGQPPAFLETVKEIRKQLFEMGGLNASDEPLTEGNIYSQWRKAVINAWKPHSMTHYMMVAKLSNRCFALVLEIAESRQTKVTQSDFLDLYTKKESEQHTLLLDLLEGRVTFEDLRKQRRAAKKVTSTGRSENDYKEMAEELERLRKRNASLQMNLEEVIEERETDRRKIRDSMDKVRNLEKEQDEAYNQYRADVSDLIWQKNRLSESLTSSVENYGADDEPFDDLEEQPSPLRVIENRVQKKRGQAPQHTGLQFEGTKKTVKFTDRQRSSSSDTSSEGDDAPLSGVQKKKYKQIIGSKTSSSKVIQQKGKQIIGSNTSSANRSSKVIQEVNLNTSEDSEDSGDWGSVSERKKADPSKETKHGKDNIRKNKTQKTEGVIRKVTEVKENISQSKPNATTAKKT